MGAFVVLACVLRGRLKKVVNFSEEKSAAPEKILATPTWIMYCIEREAMARTCSHGSAFDVGDLAVQEQLDSGVRAGHAMSEPYQVDDRQQRDQRSPMNPNTPGLRRLLRARLCPDRT